MKKLVLISGISGAGKSTASNILEDMGFTCIDQYPVELLPDLIELIKTDNSIKYEKLRSIPKEKDQINNNKIQKDLDEINFNLFPIKVEKFELICSNKVRAHEIGKENIDVSNIALNQSFEIKQPKVGENEFDDILNKNKDMEDFGQTTPISLLQEKCFIYMVSKWVKYSFPQPQSRIYTKYSYKSGHPLFDPINLDITNFTLWIERIKTKNIYNNNKGYIGINSRTNYVNKIKKTN